MSLNQQIEKQLLIALRRIDAPYREALSILDEASAAEAVNPLSVSEHLKISQRLQPSMKIITACEQQLAPLRQRWHDSGQSPSQELQEILTRQTDLLKRLIGKTQHGRNKHDFQSVTTRFEIRAVSETCCRAQSLSK